MFNYLQVALGNKYESNEMSDQQQQDQPILDIVTSDHPHHYRHHADSASSSLVGSGGITGGSSAFMSNVEQHSMDGNESNLSVVGELVILV